MTTTVSPNGSKASAALAEAGVEEDFAFYRSFTSEVEKAVLTVPQLIKAAWAANDGDFFASIFVENGSLLMQDEQLTSREDIRAFMTAGYAGIYRGASVDGWPLSVKFLADDVALVVTQGGIILDGETEIAPQREIRAVWIITLVDGHWKLVSHQSSPIAG
ncbi:SgcJ/EcaC family oxidoreductase [Amycolatopsis sp. H20-H5]|uniref:SgcJ/EcaC family oxidoreductase n=1 Tax=Amycolatopsis sp. H20-H5 TaxID=3046309 RepID=UPI002DB7A7F3|nr:SgcJ/EcaC family oxidoreductase [Amycolatopsis sp. H20-H5]MEC3975175.1 SgcJ/EcaC family oxidoreductase [Amycolatopsis sp. H20-H5]